MSTNLRSPPIESQANPTHLQLLSLLRGGEALTQAEMTEQLPIDSKRQARRLIGKLEDAGVSLEARRRGREKEYRLPPEQWGTHLRLDLSEREMMALLLTAQAASSGLGPAPLKDALRGATSALIKGLPMSVTTFEPSTMMDYIHFGEATSVEVDPDVFLNLVDALGNRRSLEIDYYSASSDRRYKGRKVDPWGLAVRGDAWLCVANDHRSGELRDFNLARIEAVWPRFSNSNGGDYQIPEDFDLELYFIDRFESLDAEEIYEVRLLVEPGAVPYFESKSYHRTQQIHDQRTEGDQIVVSYEVAGLEEIAAFVRSWGTDVTVLHPPELAHCIVQEAQGVILRHKSHNEEVGNPNADV